MINVLPENEKVLLRKEYRIRLVTVVLFIVSILLVVGVFLLTPFYILAQDKITALEIQLKQYDQSKTDSSADDLTKIISEINQNLELLNSEPSRTSIVDNVLSPILSARSNNIKISRIFYSIKMDGKSMVELNGIAVDRVALRSFEDALRKNPNIESTKLPVSNFTKKSDIDFSINITLK